jgi:hypothetical protein
MPTKLRAYPYPVLRNFVSDFKQSRFDFEGMFEITDSGLELHYSITLSDVFLAEQLADAKATLGILVNSPETLEKRWVPLTSFRGTLTFGVREFYGKVGLSAYLVSRIDSTDYRPQNVSAEFGSSSFAIKTGDPLAISEEITQDITFDWRGNTDLVTVQLNEDLDERSYVFDFAGDTLLIAVGKKVMSYYDLLREDPLTKPHLYQGIYKDAITAAIVEMSEDTDLRETSWGRNLEEKIMGLGESLHPNMTFVEANSISLQLVAADGLARVLKADHGN